MSTRIKSTPSRVIKEQFIECRDYQHAWKPHDVELDGRVYVESVICTRCATIKKRRIDKHTGAILPGGSYSYPEGYQLAGGRLTADERGTVRLIGVRRHGR